MLEEPQRHFVTESLAYVPAVARRFLGRGLPIDELTAAGNLGLVQAALRFDPDRNVKFLTYADWWIRKAIHQAIGEQVGAVRLPRYQYERLRALYAARSELMSRGREPNAEQLAETSGLAPDAIGQLLIVMRGVVSLEQPISPGDSRTFEETLADPGAVEPLRHIERLDRHRGLRRQLNTLNPRELHILRLRFGLGGTTPLTLRQAGRTLGISRERVRQIEMRALLKLRRQM